MADPAPSRTVDPARRGASRRQSSDGDASSPTMVWLEAVLCPRAVGVDPSVSALVADLRRVGVDLCLVDGASSTRRHVLRLERRGVGTDLIGALGTVPGAPAEIVRLPSGLEGLQRVVEDQVAQRRRGCVPRRAVDDGWCIVVEGVDPVRRRVDESLLALADGYIGTRGTLEECPTGSVPLVLAGGVYEPGQRTGGAETTPTLLAGPTWTALPLALPDDATTRRTLDLRCGTLLRESWHGRETILVLRFVCLGRRGVGVMRASGPSDRLGAPSTDASSHGAGRHDDRPLPSARAAMVGSGAGWIAVASTDRTSDHGAGYRSIDRRALVRSGHGSLPDPDDGWALLRQVAEVPFERLLAEQRQRWAARWCRADIEIDGDPALQRAVRFALFHLMASVPDRGRAAVGARGMTGPGYRGHVFWDADVFVLPFLAATHPASARAMLDYRFACLPAARRAAVAAGYRGARFPWESAAAGEDVTPAWVMGLEGRPVPVQTGPYEEHITADVAWATSHYLDWTADRAFERAGGQVLLRETARYWLARVEHDVAGRAHLRRVMGPDEYHVPVDDNAFTNQLVRWNLRRAAATVGVDDPPSLRNEALAWRRAADSLVDGFDDRFGRHEQFAGYGALEPILMADVGRPPVPVDVLLGSERVKASQLIKQADVLMIHHLLDGDRPTSVLRADLDFYLPRTAHGSSLSPGVYATQLARVGRCAEALDLLRLTANLDLEDLTGTTAAGIHLAAAGSLWQAIVRGFLGVRPAADALAVDPRLPATWEAVTARLTWRGTPLVLRVTAERVDVRCARRVTIRHRSRSVLVTPPGCVIEVDTADLCAQEAE